MGVVRSLFGNLNKSYLIKSYIISALIAYFLIRLMLLDDIGMVSSYIPFVILLAVLYPFSALIWDEFITMMIGQYAFLIPIPILIIMKIIKVFLLFMFSIFLAPLGILYILIRNRAG